MGKAPNFLLHCNLDPSPQLLQTRSAVTFEWVCGLPSLWLSEWP